MNNLRTPHGPAGVRTLPAIDVLAVAAAWLLAYLLRAAVAGTGASLAPFTSHASHTPTVLLLWWGASRLLTRAGIERNASGGPGWLRAWLSAGAAGASFAVLARAYWPAASHALGAMLAFVVLTGLWLTLGRHLLGRWRASADRWFECGETRVAAWLLGALSRPVPLGRGGERWVLGIGVVLLAAGYMYTAVVAELVPCALYCAESLEAYIAGLNRVRFGVWWTAGLPDLALGADVAAHPRLYTHQPYVASWVSYVGHVLGIREVEGQALLVLPVWAGGLAYMARFVGGTTGQRLLGGLMLVTAGTLYPLVTLWAFNLMRAFSWLVVWGSAYHAWRHGRAGGRWHLAAALGYVGLSLGVDYASAIYTVAHLAALARLGVIRTPWMRLLFWQGLVLGAVWVTHQAQAILALGISGWAQDMLDVVLRRVPLIAPLQRFDPGRMAASGIAGAGGTPASPAVRWPEIHRSLEPREWLAALSLPYLETVGGCLVAAVVLWGVAACLARRRMHPPGTGPLAGQPLLEASAAALAGTLVLLPGYVSATLGRDLAPGPVHLVTLLLALTAHALLAGVTRVARARGREMAAWGFAATLFVAWRGASEVRNYRELPAAGEPARAALRSIRGHTVVSPLRPPLLSAYTHEWAGFLTRAGVRRLIEASGTDFEPRREFTLHAQYVADPDNPRYRRPAFFLLRPDLPGWRCGATRVNWPVRRVGDTGCVGLEEAAEALRHLPTAAAGPTWRLYDLRSLWPAARGSR